MPILGLPPNQPTPYPAHFDIESAIRPNILALHPYRCARDDYSEGILLDANENSLGHSIVSSSSSSPNAEGTAAIEETLALPLHRYPSPVHLPIKERIAALRALPSPENVFLGVGSDEVLDLLIRVFVKPGISADDRGNEKILVTPPTYGMYGEERMGGSAWMSRHSRRRCLREKELGNTVKVIFLCSPGNPTGTLIDLDSVKEVLEWEEFKGIVLVDEAYIDFVGSAEDSDPDAEVRKASAGSLIGKYDNLVVTQTFSKGFGLAGIRLGIALASLPVVQILSNTKAPYNVSVPTAHLAEKALTPESLDFWRSNVRTLKANRASLISSLRSLAETASGVGPIIGSNDANFILVRIMQKGDNTKADSERAQKVYKYLAEQVGVVVRYRGNELGCEGCLRVTIGTEEENSEVLKRLVEALEKN
ncbi:histidinol-phosphate transaminase [Ephemerocybe angulata]|uniref:histidinol-phosphate transaminase n=1 Tax=Ephemerocybe angulata TaxID=980116 RepID=A0A8H6I2L0_9AGAR|nr:histidinol-phosphate transaminase [Tulosesus angulatus]